MMKKAVIFDLDGTIGETLESIAYCTNTLMGEYGFPPIELEKFKYLVGDGSKALIQRALEMYGMKDPQEVEEAFARYMLIFEEGCTYNVVPCAGVPDLITELKKKGVKTAVCTNKPHLQAVKVVEAAYPKGTFDIILGQSDDRAKKPAPDMALYVAEKLSAAPEDCLYLGDTNTDMQTGKNAGMFTIGVLWGFRPKEELVEDHADAIVERPMQVLDYLGE